MHRIVRALAVLVFVSFAVRADPATPARIVAGPDVLVSNDTEFPHVESMMAAHPTDPRRLVAGSMVLSGGDTGTVLYSSTDGGATWTPAHFMERMASEAD